MRKICIVTGSRAEYGLLRWVMHGIDNDPKLELQIVVTGMHLSPEYGLTYKEIEKDGFKINHKVEMLTSSDTSVGTAKSMGLGFIGMADVFSELDPDLILVLGDRYEIFVAASVALVSRIPVAHIHGGEATEGLIDEAIRHSITKMAHLHFVAANEYRQRVLQLGEQPENVFLVGGLGIDSINRITILSRPELEDSLGVKLGHRNLLVTFHPVTLERNVAKEQMNELFKALSDLESTKLIFTLPNADTEGRSLIEMIEVFVAEHPNAYLFKSLGQTLYFSCVHHFDGVIGNSSSGLLEVPSFKKGTINIGDRQRGRLQAASVINCEPTRLSIAKGLERLCSKEFQSIIQDVSSPYGMAGASEKIVDILKSASLKDILKKKFSDLPKS